MLNTTLVKKLERKSNELHEENRLVDEAVSVICEQEKLIDGMMEKLKQNDAKPDFRQQIYDSARDTLDMWKWITENDDCSGYMGAAKSEAGRALGIDVQNMKMQCALCQTYKNDLKMPWACPLAVRDDDEQFAGCNTGCIRFGYSDEYEAGEDGSALDFYKNIKSVLEDVMDEMAPHVNDAMPRRDPVVRFETEDGCIYDVKESRVSRCEHQTSSRMDFCTDGCPGHIDGECRFSDGVFIPMFEDLVERIH